MTSTRTRRAVGALSVAAILAGPFAVEHLTGATGASPDRAATAAPAVGGPGNGSGTAADRAYRDLLDHSKNAKILTVAHRAQWRSAPENSIAAIEAAFDDGAEIVELDVRLTKDGVPVLMHDTTVDRTTNGTGAVADLTLAQVQELRLKQGLGGAQAALTDHRVPTLAEAMEVIRDRGLVNLDKGWPFREEIWDVLAETGTVRNGLFKSNAPVGEVRAFLADHPDAVYMHVLSDANLNHFTEFGADQPVAYELIFGSTADAVARAPMIEQVSAVSRIWINSMWNGLADRYTDEASLIDPRRGWATLTDTYGATMIQTDDVEPLEAWIRTGRANPVPQGSVRVQAEDFLPGAGVGYHDVDAGNRGGFQMRPGEDVDISDADGNVRVSWMRGGEWLRYEVEIPRTGEYTLSARVSSPYSPAGTYRITFDDGDPSDPVAVRNTTSHNKQEVQVSGVTAPLTQGTHTLTISLDEDAFQNWNLDYLQLDPVRG
jgi:glycerophosphoryl diester phosphodiesterase